MTLGAAARASRALGPPTSSSLADESGSRCVSLLAPLAEAGAPAPAWLSTAGERFPTLAAETVLNHVGRTLRRARLRHYLMCPPTYFDVGYSINPWMDPTRSVDRTVAMQQWSTLVEAYRSTGHRVDLLEPLPGMPDMVFAANGATVVDGRALSARFANPQREAEATAHAAWHRQSGSFYGGGQVRKPVAVNEAEGDFAVLSTRILAGYGFRTTPEAHDELASMTGWEVISLELVDPRLFHLDLSLAVLDDERDHIAYYPNAFSNKSRRLLAKLFPDALIANEHDAYAFGLNAVSDGLHVFIPSGARQLREQLATGGYWPVSVDLSELIKGGGSVKCCTQEIRAARIATSRDAPLTDEASSLISDITLQRSAGASS